MFMICILCFFMLKTVYGLRISYWSSYVCSSYLGRKGQLCRTGRARGGYQCGDPLPRLPRDHRSISVDEAGLAPIGQLEPDRGLCEDGIDEIGRASCRERVCQYV